MCLRTKLGHRMAEPAVPFILKCPRCHAFGLVRQETVIKGGESLRHYDCSGCNYSWTELNVTTNADRRVAAERRRSRSTEPRKS